MQRGTVDLPAAVGAVEIRDPFVVAVPAAQLDERGKPHGLALAVAVAGADHIVAVHGDRLRLVGGEDPFPQMCGQGRGRGVACDRKIGCDGLVLADLCAETPAQRKVVHQDAVHVLVVESGEPRGDHPAAFTDEIVEPFPCPRRQCHEVRQYDRFPLWVAPVVSVHFADFGNHAPGGDGFIGSRERFHGCAGLAPFVTAVVRHRRILLLRAERFGVVKERDAAPYGPGLAEKAFVGFRRAGDFRGRCQAVARPPLEIEHTPFTGFECRRPLVQRPEDHPFGACGDTRPEPLRDLPCRGAEYLPSAGRDIAALHFGDPERVFPGSGADDVGHERDSQRVLRPGEITEVPAQVHRHAQRGQKPFVGGEIVVGEVVQKLVGIDVFVVRRVVQIDLRCDPSQVPRREVGVEPLLREVGFQVAVVVAFS